MRHEGKATNTKHDLRPGDYVGLWSGSVITIHRPTGVYYLTTVNFNALKGATLVSVENIDGFDYTVFTNE